MRFSTVRSTTHWRALGLLALALAFAPAAAGAGTIAGLQGDACAGGAGGFGEWDITGTEAMGFWRGEWDAVKRLQIDPTPMQLTKVCVCLNSSDYTPAVHDFNLVAFAADGPGGLPGTELFTTPVSAVLTRSTYNYFGFDLGSAGPVAAGSVYVGVRSVTHGPLDSGAISLCQYPRGTAGASVFYRLPQWSGGGWHPYYYRDVGDVPQVGIRALFAATSEEEQQASCRASDTRGCLAANRFQIEASYATNQGQAGAARLAALGNDTAYLTFFQDDNVEAMVKVLDGCAVNGHRWVFLGGLTNLEVEVRVTDTVSGETRTYHNAQGRPMQPVQDTRAFACEP